MKKLVLGFAVTAVAFAIAGSILAVSQYNKSGGSDVGKALLAFAVTLGAGGAAAVWVKSVEETREDRAAWRDLLRDVVEVDQTVAVARQFIAAHKTAKTYSEQYANIVAARLTLRRVWLDPLVANDQEVKSIRGHLDRMKGYVDDLGREYEESYLRVARQERIDEEYLKRLTGELASRRGAPPNLTDQVDGRAAEHERPPDLDDPYSLPTPASKMLEDPQQFERLAEFLNTNTFERSDFVEGFKKVKPMLESRAGIKKRKEEFEPQVLSTPVSASDQQRRGAVSST